MSLTGTIKWTGTRLTRRDLETLLERAVHDPDAVVHVSVEPRFNNPTDPGGAITISMESYT